MERVRNRIGRHLVHFTNDFGVSVISGITENIVIKASCIASAAKSRGDDDPVHVNETPVAGPDS